MKKSAFNKTGQSSQELKPVFCFRTNSNQNQFQPSSYPARRAVGFESVQVHLTARVDRNGNPIIEQAK